MNHVMNGVADLFLLRTNAEPIQKFWRLGVGLATEGTQRSMDQFARAFGLSGDGARVGQPTSIRDVDATMSSNIAADQKIADLWRECIDFWLTRTERNLDHITALLRCRTLQEILAAQMIMWLDNVQSLTLSGRMLSARSNSMGEESGRKITALEEASPSIPANSTSSRDTVKKSRRRTVKRSHGRRKSSRGASTRSGKSTRSKAHKRTA